MAEVCSGRCSVVGGDLVREVRELVEDQAHEGPLGLVGANEGVDEPPRADAGQRQEPDVGVVAAGVARQQREPVAGCDQGRGRRGRR